MCTCITLYNLIHRKYKAFVTCMCILLLSCLFCYKVSDSRKKNSKGSELSSMDEYSCILIMNYHVTNSKCENS